MPVEDHSIHPSTQHGSEFRYGCNSAIPRPAGYQVLTRKYNGQRYELTSEFVKDNASPDCRYMDYEMDAGCTDCPRTKDMEYINKMKGLL